MIRYYPRVGEKALDIPTKAMFGLTDHFFWTTIRADYWTTSTSGTGTVTRRADYHTIRISSGTTQNSYADLAGHLEIRSDKALPGRVIWEARVKPVANSNSFWAGVGVYNPAGGYAYWKWSASAPAYQFAMETSDGIGFARRYGDYFTEGQWYTFRIEIEGDPSAPKVHFYLDGVHKHTATALLPYNLRVRPHFYVNNVGASVNMVIDVDYSKYWAEGNAP